MTSVSINNITSDIHHPLSPRIFIKMQVTCKRNRQKKIFKNSKHDVNTKSRYSKGRFLMNMMVF